MSEAEQPSFTVVSRTDAEPSTTPWVHPLDTTETKTVLEDFLSPELATAVSGAVRPAVSFNASDKEHEEATAIQQRRLKMSGEDNGAWTARTIYEETFGVLPALTVGGVVSHTYERLRQDGREISPAILAGKLESIGVDISAMDKEQLASSLVTAAKQGRMNEGDTINLISDVVALGSFSNANAGIPERLPYRMGQSVEAVVDRAVNTSYSELLDVSTALMKAYRVLPDLTAPVTDERLLQEFPQIKGKPRDQALRTLWGGLSGRDNPVFRGDGTYKGSTDEKFADGLRKLAVVRTSPDFGFLYKGFSVTGSLAGNQ